MSNQNTEEVSGFEGSHDAMGCVQRTVKRLFDIVFSLAGMIILSPVYLVIAIMLKRQKNGPAIFSQERIGYRGKPFTIYKFRTMSEPEKEPQLVAKSSIGQSTKTELFLREHHLDELPQRITKIGHTLRKYRLDETPQFWNVLKGDMSFVGPRPERRFYIDKIMANDPSYVLIYEMRPGLTSEATLYNGYTDTMEKMLIRLHMDTDYLKRRSLALDASIIAKTFISIVSGKKF